MSEIQTESRKAFRELLDTLGEIDRRWASAEWNLIGEADVADAHRALMHMIEGGTQRRSSRPTRRARASSASSRRRASSPATTPTRSTTTPR